jgi:enoyl-CoA hydratase/carnithine racemase
VNEDDLEEETNKYVKKTLNLSSEVIQLGKKILNQQEKLEILEAYKVTAEGMQENLQKEDCKEGITAFKEKRHP